MSKLGRILPDLDQIHCLFEDFFLLPDFLGVIRPPSDSIYENQAGNVWKTWRWVRRVQVFTLVILEARLVTRDALRRINEYKVVI